MTSTVTNRTKVWKLRHGGFRARAASPRTPGVGPARMQGIARHSQKAESETRRFFKSHFDIFEPSAIAVVGTLKTMGRMTKAPLGRLLLVSALAAAAPGYGMQVANETQDGNYRFSSGFATDTPVENTSPLFIGAAYDWSGVGWMTGVTSGSATTVRVTNITMVSPLHAFSARHNGIWQLGNNARFVSETGAVVNIGLSTANPAISIPGQNHDLNITPLDRALLTAEAVTPLRILDVSSNNYVGMDALAVGSHNKTTGQVVATTWIASVTPSSSSTTIGLKLNQTDPTVSFQYWEGGDSGSPLLIPYEDTLTVAGSAWFASGAGSLLSTRPAYNPTQALNERMAQTGYALRWSIYDKPADAANTANVWQGTTGDFAGATNWSQGVAPSHLPVVFDSGDSGAVHAVSLSQNAAVRGILFRESPSTNGYVLSGPGTLTVGASGLQNRAAATQVLHTMISLSESQNWEAIGGDLVVNGAIAKNGYLLVVQGGRDTTLAGTISGAGGLAKDEAGVLSLGGANTYTGGTFIHDGTVKALVNGAIPTNSTVIFDTMNSGATLDVNGKSLVFAGIHSLRGGLGTVAMNCGTITIGGGGSASSFAGVFTGTGLISKVGSGNLSLSGNNSGYVGRLVAEEGNVVLAASRALGAGENLIKTGARLLTTDSLTVQGDAVFSAVQNSSSSMSAGFISSVVTALGNGTQVAYQGDLTLERTGTGTGLVRYAFQTGGSGAQTLRIDGDISTSGNSLGMVSLEGWVQNSAAAKVDFHGRISDSGGPVLQVVATGIAGGTTMLTSASGNDFSGGVTAMDGTSLLISNSAGSATGSGSVEIRANATLSGSGIIAPTGSHGLAVLANGRVAPGISGIGLLTVDLSQSTGRADYQSGSRFFFDLASDHANDRLNFIGTTIGDILFSLNVIDFSVSGVISPGLYTLFSFDSAGAYSGGLVMGTGLEAYETNLIYNTENIQLQVVPEANAAVLLLLGGIGVAFVRWKQREQADRIVFPKKHFPLLLFLLVFLPLKLTRAQVKVPAIFSNHMVLKKAPHVPIWGKAPSGEEVTVTLNGQVAKATADANGKWKVFLNLADSAPGPFQMTIQGKNTITINDVVVGEVWLASGQSNMEWSLWRSKDGKEEAARSANPLLRQFLVEKATSPVPKEDVQGQWVVASPQTSGAFTAVGYYFAKTLQNTLGVPVGLIHSSWGGTGSEPWTRKEALDTVEDLKTATASIHAKVQAQPEALKRWVKDFGAWLHAEHREDDVSRDRAPFCSPDAPPENAPSVAIPGLVQSGTISGRGAVWIRTEIDVAQPDGNPIPLDLGALEGFESVYCNGKPVVSLDYRNYPGTGYQRRLGKYNLPGNLLRPGKNVVAIRVYAPAEPARFPTPITIGGKPPAAGWTVTEEYALPALTASQLAAMPKAPGALPPPQLVSAFLYNAMIHPLIPYAISGVIWYQGESNTGRAFQYRTAFPLLISDWRKAWQQGDFPFYFCQLANYLEKKSVPTESSWAEGREAQSMALSLPATGQAVLIDLGDAGDVHPLNKKDVGERLARIALARDYGKPLAYSGPVHTDVTFADGKARIRFAHADGGLVAKPLPETYSVVSGENRTAPTVRNSPNSEVEGFAICGEDRKWVWADARIDGDSVEVWADTVPAPVAVRYGWADNPTLNLCNGAGLPASPFRTDDFPTITLKGRYGF